MFGITRKPNICNVDRASNEGFQHRYDILLTYDGFHDVLELVPVHAA
jgi:hypothetical protein